MSIKVGNKIISNIPEAVSFLLQEVEAIKKERVETPVRVYEFEEGTILTDAIYEEIKAGDIISVDGKQFLVSKPLQTPRAFYGYYVSSITSTSATIIKLEWEGINAFFLLLQ